MNIGVYYRVSTDKQDIESQKRAVEKFISKLDGVESITEYSDIITGGKTTKKRIGLDQMIENIKAGLIDTVIVFKLDRLGRSIVGLNAITKVISENSCRLYSVNDLYINDPNLPDTMFHFFIATIGLVAELELNNIKDRTKAGVDNARSKGIKLGRPTVNEKTKSKIIQLRKNGVHISTIQAETGLSRTTIWKILKTA